MRTLHGTFHLPATPEDKFGGILSRVEGGLELEAVGWDTTDDRHDVLVGLLADGSAVTLVEVVRKTSTFGVYGARPTFRVWHLLIGWAFDNLADIELMRVSASFTDLSIWWSWNRRFEFSDGAARFGITLVLGPTIVMRYERGETITATLPDARVEAGPREAQSSDARRYRIEAATRVAIEWNTTQTMKRMFSDLAAMETLLWAILDQPSLFRGITIENDAFKARVFGGSSSVVQAIQVRTTLRTRRPLARSHALFPRPMEVAPHFDILCNGWYGLWASHRAVLGAMAEADIESSRSRLVTRPVQLAWYMAHAKALDAIWLLANPGGKRIEHIDVLKSLFGSHGPPLFDDPARQPDWAAMAREMYSVRNDAGHARVTLPRSLKMEEIQRAMDIVAMLGRVLLLELAGLPRSVAIEWIKRGSRWMHIRDTQKPGVGL